MGAARNLNSDSGEVQASGLTQQALSQQRLLQAREAVARPGEAKGILASRADGW